MDKAGKNKEVEFLTQTLGKAQVALCADYRGLTVKQITELRRELRANGARGRVVKNTLMRRSINDAYKGEKKEEVSKFLGLFTGPSLVAYSFDNPVGPAKVFTKFGKANEKFSIRGGWFSGACMDQKGVQTLATMPSREELLAKLLALINAPATQLLRVMKAPGEQVARALEAHRKNLESAGK